MSLSLVSGGVSVAASTKHGHARRLSTPEKKKSHFVEWGGGKGVFTVVSPKNGTACRLTTPLPPLLSGKNQRSPSTALHVPYPPPKNKPFVKWGGGNRGGSPWRCPRTTLQVAYPPLEKPTIRVMGGGGKGVFTVALHKHGTARRRSPPSPPLMSGIIKN